MRHDISALLTMVSFAWYAQCACAGEARGDASHKQVQARISVTGLEVNPEGFVLHYEVANESPQDVWVCDDMNAYGKWHFEAVFAKETRALIIRKRLDILADPLPLVERYGLPIERPVATYSRLKPGAQRRESLSLPLPVPCQRVLSYPQPTSGVVYAERALLQISFYGGDLPAAIRGVLADAESASADNSCNFVSLPKFGVLSAKGLWQLNSLNKTIDNTTDRVAIPYTLQKCFAVDVLQIRVDGVHIPYKETADSSEIPRGIIKDIPNGGLNGDSLSVATGPRRWRGLIHLGGLLVSARAPTSAGAGNIPFGGADTSHLRVICSCV